MRASRFLLVGLWGLLGFTNSANAALLGTVCTFAGGCGPDFAILGASADYVYNGSVGTLTISGTTGNASFLPGQLEPWPDATETMGALAGKDPDISINVLAATALGNDNFSLTMTVDGAGSLLGGSMTMNGKVAQFFSSLNNTNPAFQTPGLYTAKSANGTALDGALISGSTITSMGFNASTIDFYAALDPGSVLSVAGFGTTGSGIIGLTNISGSGNIDWGTNWTATASLDVVVPLPAALWLFLSGIAVLFSTSRSKLMNS